MPAAAKSSWSYSGTEARVGYDYALMVNGDPTKSFRTKVYHRSWVQVMREQIVRKRWMNTRNNHVVDLRLTD